MNPRSAAEREPRTRAGQSLLRQWSGHVNEPEVRIVVLAIEAEATTTVPADAWQAGYEACWNRLNDAGRLLPSDGATAAVPLDVERLREAMDLHHIESAARAVLLPPFGHICNRSCAESIYARLANADEEGGTT